jgi:hypothetical protein
VTRTKTKEATESFRLDVECAPSGNLQRYDAGQPVFDQQGTPVPTPGKVDAYRFMSFYLDSTRDNFEDFYAKVVDPIWLAQSSDPDAAALRQARQSQKKPPCWRVLHRVTFVSRVLEPVPPPTASPLEKAMRAENIDSNYQLIQQLEPYVQKATTSLSALANATRDALAARLPELIPHAQDIIGYLALYYDVHD